MVVVGLETYMKNTPGVFESANIKEIILKEKGKIYDSKKKPAILLDNFSLFFLIYPKKLFSICNFQPKILKRNIEKFVEDITSLGVDLIVVLRKSGKKINDIFKKWSYKMQCFHKFWENINENLQRNVSNIQILNFKYHVFSSYTDIILSQISNENYISVSAKSVQEIVNIAKKYNCFGVIGQDSNYIIYDSISVYIQTNSINLKTLDCYTFNKNKLCEHLKIKPYQLPLFATLCGNEIIQEKKLELFHKRISENGADKFLAIANLVKPTTEDSYLHLNEFVNIINIKDIDINLLSKSLDMYLKEPKPIMHTDFIHILAERKENLCEISSLFCTILLRKEFAGSGLIENLFDKNFFPSVKLFSSLRAKIYGIILHAEKFSQVKEYYLESFEKIKFSDFKPNLVYPIKPQSKHPGLISLWTDSRTSPKNRIRWDLLCTTVSKTLSQYSLRYVPSELLIPVLAIHYLACEIPEITSFRVFKNEFEVKVLLLTVIRVFGNLDQGDFEQCAPDYRALHINNYFIMCCDYLVTLNQACGFVISNEESALHYYYNGALFQHIYQNLENYDDCIKYLKGNAVLEITFYTLMGLITSGVN